jgi:hypothetical protein
LNWVSLSQGRNALLVEARDKAGNVTRRELNITYIPNTELAVFNFDGTINQISPNHFLVQEKGFILVGKTMQGSRVSLKSVQSDYKATTYADESGLFHFSVALSRPKEEFICTRRTPSNQYAEEHLVVERSGHNPIIQLTQPLPQVTTDTNLALSGKLVHGTALRINGCEVSLTEGEFTEIIELKPGGNSIRLEAYDAVKNLTVMEKKVILDQEAPALLNIALSEKTARGGELVRIEVYAKDSSRMRRSAPFTVEVSSFVYHGLLVLSRANGAYVGNVQIPKNAHGRIKLTRVLLEDYCGNQKEYIF